MVVGRTARHDAPSQRALLEEHRRIERFEGVEHAQHRPLAHVIARTRAVGLHGADEHVLSVACGDLEESVAPHAAADRAGRGELAPSAPHGALIGTNAPCVRCDTM